MPIKDEGLADNDNQIGSERRSEIKFYEETGWPAVLEKYFKTVEKYKDSIDGMKQDLKIQVAQCFKRLMVRNI